MDQGYLFPVRQKTAELPLTRWYTRARHSRHLQQQQCSATQQQGQSHSVCELPNLAQHVWLLCRGKKVKTSTHYRRAHAWYVCDHVTNCTACSIVAGTNSVEPEGTADPWQRTSPPDVQGALQQRLSASTVNSRCIAHATTIFHDSKKCLSLSLDAGSLLSR